MIGHEAVCPHLDSGLARLPSQQISINFLVAVLKKDRFPTIPTLYNVMRKPGNHRPRQSCHGEKCHERPNRGQVSSPPISPDVAYPPRRYATG
jgi:hypothetical protein